MKRSCSVSWRGSCLGTACALSTQNYTGVETVYYHAASRLAIVPLTFSARIPARWEQPVSLPKLYLHDTLSVGTTVIRAILRGSNRLKHAVDVTAFAVTLLLKTWCLTATLIWRRWNLALLFIFWQIIAKTNCQQSLKNSWKTWSETQAD